MADPHSKVIEIDDNRKWIIAGGLVCVAGAELIEGGAIVIPYDQIIGMTPEQIGSEVLKHQITARLFYAEWLSQTYTVEANWSYFSSNPDKEELAIKIEEDKVWIQCYADRSENCKNALFIISSFEESERLRKERKVAAVKARRAIRIDYDSIFVRIGKRDGFHCAKCSATSDLQLDHIKPISVGGETIDANLQILCRSCNLEKGIQTIDYRKKV
jgi:hypothetical protein